MFILSLTFVRRIDVCRRKISEKAFNCLLRECVWKIIIGNGDKLDSVPK
jgi:hypothetical protein